MSSAFLRDMQLSADASKCGADLHDRDLIETRLRRENVRSGTRAWVNFPISRRMRADQRTQYRKPIFSCCQRVDFEGPEVLPGGYRSVVKVDRSGSDPVPGQARGSGGNPHNPLSGHRGVDLTRRLGDISRVSRVYLLVDKSLIKTEKQAQ